MGVVDRNRELRDVADLLEHVRRKQFTFSEYADIFEAVRSHLESVQGDVEESADSLEERFESRAEELRDKYEWVQDALDQAEEAAGSFTEEDVAEESFDETADRAEEFANQIEDAIEETPGPHKSLPAIAGLVTFTQKDERTVEVKKQAQTSSGADVWEKVLRLSGGDKTDRNIRNAFRAGIINKEELSSALSNIFSALRDLGEWRFYLGRNLIEYDIKIFVLWGSMTEQQADRWRAILKQKR